MTNEQVMAVHQIKYRKVIKVAKIIFEYWEAEPQTDIVIYDFFPVVEAVTLANDRVYVLTLTYHCEGLDFSMKAYNFEGLGKNGLPIYTQRS